MGRADLSELGEDGGFEAEDFGHGFDDHVDAGEVIHVGCWCEALSRGIGVGLGEFLLGDVFGEEFV